MKKDVNKNNNIKKNINNVNKNLKDKNIKISSIFFKKKKDIIEERKRIKRALLFKKLLKESFLLLIIAFIIFFLLSIINDYNKKQEDIRLGSCLKKNFILYGYDYEEDTIKQKNILGDIFKDVNYVNCAFNNCSYDSLTWVLKNKNIYYKKILSKKDLINICVYFNSIH